jgi:hypothetical protein
MKRLARAPNIAVAALWADALCQAGFDASVQRYFLGSIAGDLPPDQCLPEVWIGDDAQEAGAKEMLEQLRSLPQRRWTCACGEEVEGGFESCWNCGLEMPAD